MEKDLIIQMRLEGISMMPGSSSNNYEDMLKLIHKEANNMDIQFSEQLRERFHVSTWTLKFDPAFFDAGFHNPMFVFMAALANQDVFSWLKTAYELTHDDEFTTEILAEEIERYKKKGWEVYMFNYVVLNNDETEQPSLPDEFTEEEFEAFMALDTPDERDAGTIYSPRNFSTPANHTFDIKFTKVVYLDNNEVTVEFTIEYDNTKTFYADLDIDDSFNQANSYSWSKRNDELYLLAEDQIKDQIGVWIDGIHEMDAHKSGTFTISKESLEQLNKIAESNNQSVVNIVQELIRKEFEK